MPKTFAWFEDRKRPPSEYEELTVGLHFGEEALVHTRVGTYYEPARYTDRSVGRQHFTFGADLKLFSTTWFGLVPDVFYKLQASADFAPRYQSVSLGLGVWH